MSEGTNALLVTGVRQAGKTYLIERCLKESGRPYLEFNLVENPLLAKNLNESCSRGADAVMMALRAYAGRPLEPGTIVFIDEVQEARELVTAMKFLVLKGKCRFILSGSLLGVELSNLRSAPVGYLSHLDLYPLDLEEWYIASGLGEDVLALVKACFEEKRPVPEAFHLSLIESFYRYLLVGGMPSAVSEFVESQDVGKVALIQDDIIRLYKGDFTKYEKASHIHLTMLYDLVPAELLKANRRYYIDDLNRGKESSYSYARLEDGFEWLRVSGVAVPCLNVRDFEIPLLMSVKRSLFKLYYSDVGLLARCYGPETALSLLGDRSQANIGALFENFAANELDKHGYPLYYLNSKKRGELDFIIEKGGAPVPIEIKSGSSHKVHRAIDNFAPDCKEAYVFSTHNVEVEGKIAYLPIYMLMFLDNRNYGFRATAVDLSTLGL